MTDRMLVAVPTEDHFHFLRFIYYDVFNLHAWHNYVEFFYTSCLIGSGVTIVCELWERN